jgi:hypothetical protein
MAAFFSRGGDIWRCRPAKIQIRRSIHPGDFESVIFYLEPLGNEDPRKRKMVENIGQALDVMACPHKENRGYLCPKKAGEKRT